MRIATENSLRELSGEVLRVQGEELRRIARELHDGTGQTLSALKMALTVLEKSFPLIADAPALQEVREFADRTTSYLLHPPLWDDSGLESALCWFTTGYAERSNVEMTLIIDGPKDRLPAECELCLFRVAQECLTNIYRHSGSKTATVRLKRTAETIKLEITDSGKGVPEDLQRKIALGESTGVGLRGMRERVRKLDGQMSIQSGECGTTVTILLPIKPTIGLKMKSVAHRRAPRLN